MKKHLNCIGVLLLISVTILNLNGCRSLAGKLTGTSHIRQIQENGVPAKATIIKIWDTNARVNNYPIIGFLLKIQAPDRDSYETTTKCIISIVDIPKIQPGTVLPAKFDPENPKKVALDICRSL